MSVVFRGRFDAKLDQKGRLNLPSAYKATASSSGADEAHTLVVTNSIYQGRRCLDVYTYSAWEALEKRIARLSPLKAEVQAFQRFYLASGQVVETDGQGRALIPAGLRRFAGLESEVVLVGMGEKFEVWSADVWNSLYDNMAESFDDILAAVSSLQETEK